MARTSMESGAPQRSARPQGALAFITGCGRSGTTILGQILSRHPQIRYLNDRFDLWVDPLPVTDIWGRREMRARLRGDPGLAPVQEHRPRIALTAEDAAGLTALERRRLGARLDAERRGRPLLVEKLAINNFRLGFITAICPDASLVNIVRHGVEVARSIEQKASLGQWYGLQDRKWSLLCEHAVARGLGELLSLCEGEDRAYERGLLEWRLSIEAAESFFARDTRTRVLHLRYEELIADAAAVSDRLLSFLHLPPDDAMRQFAATEVRRLNPAAHERPIPPSTEQLAGATLRRLGYSLER